MKITKLVTLMLMACVLLVSTGCKKKDKKSSKGKAAVEKNLDPNRNLCYNGDFNKDDSPDIYGDGSDVEIVEGAGIDGTGALSVEQMETWGGCVINATEWYGKGKSYYVEAWFKDNGSRNRADMTGHISFSVASGTVFETTDGAYYDCDDIYNTVFMFDDEAEEVYGLATNNAGVEFDDTEFRKVCGVIPAEEIENKIDESGLYVFNISIYAGEYPNQGGMNYYLDNVIVRDLNPELPVQGQTYEVSEDFWEE